MLSALVSRRCELTVSIDNDPAVLRNARQFFDEVDADVWLVRGDALNLPFGNAVFEAVFSQGLLEHLSDTDMTRVLEEQLRVGEHVYASVPSFYYPHAGRFGPGLIGNERLMTTRQYLKILSRFRVKAEYYADFKMATLAGWTVPWPNQILLELARS
jgi:SAM-dependent methyltransferase